MMQISKKIPVIYLKDGTVYEDEACSVIFTCEDGCSASVYYSNQGAESLAIIEKSDSELDHERNIGCIKNLVFEAEIPVYAGGSVKRFEDVKKYLYTGADKALFLPDIKACGQEGRTWHTALSESCARFGKEKLIFCSDGETFATYQKEVRECTGALCITDLDMDDSVETELPIYVLVSGREAVYQMSKTELRPALAWQDLVQNSDGLVPVVVQDYKTSQVLMLAYMNEEAFEKTLLTGRMTYYSRSREELWVKGLTSGHYQYVKELSADCDRDTLLAKVSQIGNACHTGRYSCFFDEIAKKDYRAVNPLAVLEQEYHTILDRKENPKEGSYTNYLFDKGIDKILKKVGEEAAEIIIAAKNPEPEEIKYEIADFLYHVMVLMVEKGVSWEDIIREISNR